MDLEKKLAKWAERAQDDEEDDYGLIIDDSVTTAAPQAGPHSSFTKRVPSSQIRLLPNAIQPLLPSNLPLLVKPLYPSTAAKYTSERSVPAHDILQRYAEPADAENYDDLVLPEEADSLDRQLAEWKAPCRRMPSWPNNLNSETAVPLSDSTAVDDATGRGRLASSGRATLGSNTSTTTATLTGSGVAGSSSTALGTITAGSHGGPRGSAPTSRNYASGPSTNASASLGLGVAEGENGKPLLITSARQQRAPSSKQRVAEWQQKGKQLQNEAQQMQQLRRSSRRPMLIRNVSRPAEPVVVGCMRYDPISRLWVGNEEEGSRIANAIAESERQLRAGGLIRHERPLDAGKLARKISQRSGNPNLVPATPEDILAAEHEPVTPRLVHHTHDNAQELALGKAIDPKLADAKNAGAAGSKAGEIRQRTRPIFDPQNLRWIDPNESQMDPKQDPFWNIDDLPEEPIGSDSSSIHKGNGQARGGLGPEPAGSCGAADISVFSLSSEQIEAYKRESREYESFARHWFPKSSA